MKTNIVYFTDVKKKTGTQKYWHFKIENDGYSLDSHRRKLDGESDLDKLSAVDFDDTNEFAILGFRQVEVSDIQDKDYNLTHVEDVRPTIGKYDFVRLGDIAEIVNGGTPNTKLPEYWDGGIPWATLVDVKGKYVYDTQRHISKLGLENSNAKTLPIDTVILSSRATIGEVAIAKVEMSTNQGFKNLVCDTKRVLPEYLYYVLCQSKEAVSSLATGSTFLEVSKTSISNFEIPLPPIEVQQKIVTELEELHKIINGSKKLIEIYTQKIADRIGRLWTE